MDRPYIFEGENYTSVPPHTHLKLLVHIFVCLTYTCNRAYDGIL